MQSVCVALPSSRTRLSRWAQAGSCSLGGLRNKGGSHRRGWVPRRTGSLAGRTRGRRRPQSPQKLPQILGWPALCWQERAPETRQGTRAGSPAGRWCGARAWKTPGRPAEASQGSHVSSRCGQKSSHRICPNGRLQ